MGKSSTTYLLEYRLSHQFAGPDGKMLACVAFAAAIRYSCEYQLMSLPHVDEGTLL